MSLEDLYQEVILDHFRKPRCHACIAAPTQTATLYNPLCGDQIALTIKLDGNKVAEIGFGGQGCSISQASASMMSELCHGKTLAEIRELIESFRAMMRGEKHGEDLPQLGDAAALEGVRKFSARVKCAMLAWEAIEKCLSDTLPKS
jgi:nitrogen fixation NifU-like protein